MVMEGRLGCLPVLPCPIVQPKQDSNLFLPYLIDALSPKPFLPIFWLSYLFQCLDCSFSEAKTDFLLLLSAEGGVTPFCCTVFWSQYCGQWEHTNFLGAGFCIIKKGLHFNIRVQKSLYPHGETLLLPRPWYPLIAKTSKKLEQLGVCIQLKCHVSARFPWSP